MSLSRSTHLICSLLTVSVVAGCREQQPLTNAPSSATKALAPTPPAEVSSAEFVRKLQGSWTVEAAYYDGEQVMAADLGIFYTFVGNDLYPSDNPADIAKFLIDASHSPIQINLMPEQGDRRPVPGIIRLTQNTGEPDRLEWNLADASAARPTEFKSVKGRKEGYFLMKRKAP